MPRNEQAGSDQLSDQLSDQQAAQYATHEVMMRQTLTRHRDGCPAERIEVSQERGPVKVVRCIDCGEQATTMAP